MSINEPKYRRSLRILPVCGKKAVESWSFHISWPPQNVHCSLQHISVNIFAGLKTTSLRHNVYSKGPYIKYDRNFLAFFNPLPPSDCKMMSLLLNRKTSLLLILTAICQPPLPPRLRSYLMYGPQDKDSLVTDAFVAPNTVMYSIKFRSSIKRLY